MYATEFEPIRVLAVFAGSKTKDLQHRVTPLRFRTSKGELHRIDRIRRVYRDQKGTKTFLHFVVVTEQGRYFDIVFDPLNSLWKLVLEVDTAFLVDDFESSRTQS
jgi:hypothetical protein